MNLEKGIEIPWNDDTRYALGFCRIYAKLLGIWPLDRETIFPTMIFSLFITMQIGLITTYVSFLIKIGYCGRTLDFVEVLTMLTISSGALCKVIIPWKHLDKMYFVINSIAEDWTKLYDRKSYETVMEYANRGRTVCLAQLFFSSFLVFRTILLKLPDTVETTDAEANFTALLRIVPYGPACWVSTTMSVHYYHAYYWFICIHWIIAAVAYVGNDVYIFGLGMHMCGQFELLNVELQAICNDEHKDDQYGKLVLFIERHKHLLRVAHTLEEVYNTVILTEVVANTFVISISGIIVLWAVKIHSRAMAVPKLIRIYLFFTEIFMISYVGERLSVQTEKLQVSIYNLPWYKMPAGIMKNILFITMRINHPFNLTAGKIINMNYESFKNIVKSTFSYFSILRLMLEE